MDTAGYVPGTPFTINVTCDGITRTLSLADGGTDTTLTAPVGAACTVTEDTPADPSGYAYDAPQVSPANFTMPAGGQTVTVTNNLVEQLAITISVAVGGNTSVYPGDPFIINVICNGTTTSASIIGGNTDNTTVRAPLGASCTVTQTLPSPPTGYRYDATISPDQFIMAVGQTITVTNNLVRALSGEPQDIPINPAWLMFLLVTGISTLAYRQKRRRR